MSKAYRMSRIFRPETNNTLILPIDHGVSYGEVFGLENPKKVLQDLLTSDVDAVLMSEGVAKRTESKFYGKETPARIITADVVFSEEGEIYHELYTDVKTASLYGYDCMKLIMYQDRPAVERMKSTKLISKVINESDNFNIPVLVEPLIYEEVNDYKKRIEMLTDGARIAYELGADILKLPHPGKKEIVEEWVNNFDVPIILLGGAMNSNLNGIIDDIETAISTGVRGVAIGRNVWQRPVDEAKDMLQKLNNIIHKG